MAVVESSIINEISGKIGNLVFYRRYDKNCVRKWVKPADPGTALQVSRRNSFACLVKTWQSMTPAMKKSWNNYPGKRGRSYNAFMSENMKRLDRKEEVILRFSSWKILNKISGKKYKAHSEDSSSTQPLFSLVTALMNPQVTINNPIKHSECNRDGPCMLIVRFHRNIYGINKEIKNY